MKPIPTLLFFVATILILIPSFAQDGIKPPYIEVIGTARTEVVPDEIYIDITLRERMEGREKITIEMQEKRLKETLVNIGVPLSDIYFSGANADYLKIKWSKKDVLSKIDYTLKVSDAETVGKVFGKLGGLKIFDAKIDKVDHSKIDSLRKEVRISAIKAAKSKADYLLAAIGEKTGKPLVVEESRKVNPSYNSTLNRSANFTISENYTKFSGEGNIQFQKIELRSSIYVKFEIQ